MAWRKWAGAFGIVAVAVIAAACGTLPASPRTAASAPPPTTRVAPAETAAPPTVAAPTTATPETAGPTTATPPPTNTPPATATTPTTAGSASRSPTTGATGSGSPATTPATTVPRAANLQLGSSGPGVLALQQRLTSLGFWLGSEDGFFGDSTEQAVYAYQKAAGLTPDGVVGARTTAALMSGVVPHARSTSGYVIEVNLADDLVMFVDNGKVEYTLNTSTGGGYTYSSGGITAVANTPVGVFNIIRQVNGMVTDSLGQLWRPKFFYSGFAIHGDSYVPPFPVSHGCVRVSDEAIDWIWANNLAPIGTEVWVY